MSSSRTNLTSSSSASTWNFNHWMKSLRGTELSSSSITTSRCYCAQRKQHKKQFIRFLQSNSIIMSSIFVLNKKYSVVFLRRLTPERKVIGLKFKIYFFWTEGNKINSLPTVQKSKPFNKYLQETWMWSTLNISNSDQFFLHEFFYLLKMDGLKLTFKNSNKGSFSTQAFYSVKRGV